MRIRLVREGGLAGIRVKAVVDTKTLEPSRAEELHRLLESVRSEGPAVPGKQKTHADRFGYTLTVEEKGRSETMRFGEEDAPENLRGLVEAIWQASGGKGPPDVREA
jgi:hypothetical protein